MIMVRLGQLDSLTRPQRTPPLGAQSEVTDKREGKRGQERRMYLKR